MRAIRYVGLPCGLATPIMIYLAETQSFKERKCGAGRCEHCVDEPPCATQVLAPFVRRVFFAPLARGTVKADAFPTLSRMTASQKTKVQDTKGIYTKICGKADTNRAKVCRREDEPSVSKQNITRSERM